MFGEIWRLEPLSVERKALWKREMEWLLSIADHIVEFVPSLQTFQDGSTFEVNLHTQTSIPFLSKQKLCIVKNVSIHQ